jgi:hypothetical protein
MARGCEGRLAHPVRKCRRADQRSRRLLARQLTTVVAGNSFYVIGGNNNRGLVGGVERATSSVLGSFRESHATRSEFLALIDRPKP